MDICWHAYLHMLSCNTGALQSFSASRRKETGSAAEVAYRNAPWHTVASPGLHSECIAANRSITGTDRNHFLSQTGSGT